MGGKEKMEAQGVQVCEGREGRRRWKGGTVGWRCVRGGRRSVTRFIQGSRGE